jgi:hypothetical protein
MADFLSAAGPIFGPDFVLVTVNDDTGTQYQLEVYPDASNDELRAAGRPMQFYWQPARVYLAKKQDSPKDFDFGMTVFKGLLTTETTVGVTDTQTTDGAVEEGGGFCTFSTTFAVPDSVVANAVKALKAGEHPDPAPWLSHLFGSQPDQPDPLLGIVPILEDAVTIEIPNLATATTGSKAPMYIDAQGTGKGSIEAHGFSSFLVTCNELAAGAIAGSLGAGKSPFTIHCTLKEQVYIHGCQVKVHLDVDKCYAQVSAALDTGGFFGITEASLQASYQNMVTSGAITTEIQMDNANLTPELEDWIKKNVDDMKTTAFQALKSEIFDWKPREDPPATAERGLFSSIFGGASVSLKASYQRHAVHLDQVLKLDSSISVSNTISGDLNDLLPAVTADRDKYISVIDIGEPFQKIQVAGTSAINFAEVVDGVDLRDPIESVSLEVSYPDFSHPVGADSKPNLMTLAQGFHYTIGNKDPNAAAQLATWSKDNPHDVVNIAFLRLDKPVPDWPANQVKLTKTLVFDGQDPRVDLSSGGSTFVIETVGTEHAPKLTADEAGYVFVRFMLDRVLPTENINLSLACTIGSRTDTFTINAANQKNVIWEIFSDKYFDETEFSYTVDVEISGPDFTDDAVTYTTTTPVKVPLPAGRIKYVNPFKLALPKAPANQIAVINSYIAAFPPA